MLHGSQRQVVCSALLERLGDFIRESHEELRVISIFDGYRKKLFHCIKESPDLSRGKFDTNRTLREYVTRTLTFRHSLLLH